MSSEGLAQEAFSGQCITWYTTVISCKALVLCITKTTSAFFVKENVADALKTVWIIGLTTQNKNPDFLISK